MNSIFDSCFAEVAFSKSDPLDVNPSDPLGCFCCGASVQDPVPSNVGEASVDHANEARRSDKIMVICQFLGTRNVNVLNRKHPQSGFIAGVPCLG